MLHFFNIVENIQVFFYSTCTKYNQNKPKIDTNSCIQVLVCSKCPNTNLINGVLRDTAKDLQLQLIIRTL